MSSPVGISFRFRKPSLDESLRDHELDVEGGGPPDTFQSKKSPGKPSRVLLLTLVLGLALAGLGLCSLLMDSPFLAAMKQYRGSEGMKQALPSATEQELEAPLGNIDEERDDSPFLAAMIQYRRFLGLGCKYLRMELEYRGFEGVTQGFQAATGKELEAPFDNLDEDLEKIADNNDMAQLVDEESFEEENSVTSELPSVEAELAQSHEPPKAPQRLEAVEILADANHVVAPEVELVETQEKVEESNAARGVDAAAFVPSNASDAEPQAPPHAVVQAAPAQVKAEATTTGADEAIVRQQVVAAAAKAAVAQQKAQRVARQAAPAQKPAQVKQTRKDSKRQAGSGDFERRAGHGDMERRSGRGDFKRRSGRGDTKRRGKSERRGGQGDRYGGRKDLEGRGKKRRGGRRGGEF